MATLDDLLAQAEDLRNDAEALLVGEGLLAMLESTGPTRVVGSYALDLMTSPDIDFSVQLPHELDIPTFFDLGRRIVGRFEVAKMQFDNAFIQPIGSFDHGLYWGVRLAHLDRKWKLDIWGFGEDAYVAKLREFEDLAARLARADRNTILRIKDAVCRRAEFGIKLTSWHVYEAITRHGVASVEEFDSWYAAQGG